MITDIMGKKAYSQHLASGLAAGSLLTIPVSNLAAGTYILQLVSPQGNPGTQVKFIKE